MFYRFSFFSLSLRFPPKPPAGGGGVGPSDELCVREEDVLRFCFPDKEAIRPVRSGQAASFGVRVCDFCDYVILFCERCCCSRHVGLVQPLCAFVCVAFV